MDEVKFSVVIPAYNEAGHIAAAVRGLCAQSISREAYEIIVVDNASTDDTFSMALQAGADKVILESRQGTNFARQRGVEESRGEIVAFLDSDCIPPYGWLARIGRLLADPSVKAVSGPCDFGFRGLARLGDQLYVRRVFPVLDRVLFFIFRKEAGVIMGGNFAVHRRTLDQIGGFPPFKFHGDDSAVAMLISRRVGRVRFCPELRVRSSPRRFENEGHLRLTLVYAWYYLKNFFLIH